MIDLYTFIFSIVFFSRFETGDIVKISFTLSNLNIQSRFIGKFGEMAHLMVDTPNHTIQGFIVDTICHQNTAFTRQDHGISFKNNNLWLFIDNNDTTLSTADSIVSMNLGGNE